MIKSFLISFKLKNTYRVNSIIYSLKQLPIIKSFLPNSLYKSKTLKVLANILNSIIEFVSIFLGKILYLLIMILFVIEIYKTDLASTFLHMFFFLSIIGGLLNTFMFNPTKDKYYAIIIMNMDAKKYTLSNYYYTMLKTIIGFLPFTIIIGLKVKLPLIVCFLLPIFVVMIKMIFSCHGLIDFKETGKVTNENLPFKAVWISVVLLLLCSYGLPFLNIVINLKVFLILFLISFIFGLYSFIKINKFDKYKKMYKEILTENNVYFSQKQSSTEALKENVSKQIELDERFKSNKSGFSYFHDLFVKRHRKILTTSAEKQSIVILCLLIVIIVTCFLYSDFSRKVNELLLIWLPYFVFIMYLLNRGTLYTQAMFMNCDHSMLTYRIFRTPKVILGLFKERLKTLIKINLIPASIIAIGLPLLLYITGGNDNPLNYIVLFLSIISMSVFFSVHYLVMYYLLQPYNISTEMKSSTYTVAQSITYFICYGLIRFELPTIYFGLSAIIFCLVYVCISLYLVYKLAPKTFKLRI